MVREGEVVTDGGHVSFEMGVNILLTSCTWVLIRKEHKGSTLQLARLRVARREKRKSTIADFRVSGFQRRRARELDASTCEVAIGKKCQREVSKESGPSIKGDAW
jgi:hypothetical protein